MPNDCSRAVSCGDLACESSTTSQCMSLTSMSVCASRVRSAICSGRLYVGVMTYMVLGAPSAVPDALGTQLALYTTYRAICLVMPVNRSLDTWTSSSMTTLDRAIDTRSSATVSGLTSGWPCCCDQVPDVWYWTSTTNTVTIASIHRMRICMDTGKIIITPDGGHQFAVRVRIVLENKIERRTFSTLFCTRVRAAKTRTLSFVSFYYYFFFHQRAVMLVQKTRREDCSLRATITRNTWCDIATSIPCDAVDFLYT